MSAVTIDGELVHYEAFGRGRPVLFLHGWLGSWRYWMRCMEAISDKNRTYALDLWGFGDSRKIKTRYNLEDYVALVEGFVENIGIQELSLVGHGLGAIILLEYARRNPDQTRRLMTVSLPLKINDINHRLLRLQLLQAVDKSWLTKMLLWGHQALPKEVRAEVEKTDVEVIYSTLASLVDLNLCQRLQDIGQAPDQTLLMVYGLHDKIVASAPLRRLNGQWPNIRTIGLADSGYFPMLDQPAKFQRLLKDFLEIEDDLSALALKKEWRRRAR